MDVVACNMDSAKVQLHLG